MNISSLTGTLHIKNFQTHTFYLLPYSFLTFSFHGSSCCFPVVRVSLTFAVCTAPRISIYLHRNQISCKFKLHKSLLCLSCLNISLNTSADRIWDNSVHQSSSIATVPTKTMISSHALHLCTHNDNNVYTVAVTWRCALNRRAKLSAYLVLKFDLITYSIRNQNIYLLSFN